jgi:hypothetical protein
MLPGQIGRLGCWAAADGNGDGNPAELWQTLLDSSDPSIAFGIDTPTSAADGPEVPSQ